MKFALHIDTDLVGRRLDPAYYSPSALEQIKRLKAAAFETKTLRVLCPRMNSGPFGSALLAEQYVKKSDNAVIFFRPVDCKDVITDTNNENVFISREDNQRLRSSSFPSGSLIFTKIGNSIGDVSVVPQRISNCNISGNMMGMVPSLADPYYLVSFLKSSNGASQIQRGIIGGPMPKIDTESLGEIVVSLPDAEIQQAIGNKVRKAERLREVANSKWQAALGILKARCKSTLEPEGFIGFPVAEVSSPGYQCIATKPPVSWAVVSDELGAQYFHPRRVFARQLVNRTGACAPLSEVADRINQSSAVSDTAFVGLDAIDSAAGIIQFGVATSDELTNGASTFMGGDIVFSRLRPYLNKVAIIPDGLTSGHGSGELLVFRPKSIDPYYLFFVLKSQLALNQVVDVTSGSTHPRVDSQVVEDILVPRLGEEDERSIEMLIKGAHAAWYESMELIPAAQADVESLISNTLDLDALHAESASIESWLAANPSPVTSKN